jgi:hypothetical protein
METLATVLVPYRGQARPEVEAEYAAGNAMHGRPSLLRLAWPDGTRESVTWSAGLESMLGRTAAGETDGVLLYRREGGPGAPTAAAVDATWVERFADAALLRRPQPRILAHDK